MKPNLLEGEYEVEKIVDRIVSGSNVTYLVNWKDYRESDNSWERSKDLFKCRDLIIQFEDELYAKPIKKNRRLYEITGMKIYHNVLYFKIKWSKADLSRQILPAAQVYKYWRPAALKFLDNQIRRAYKKNPKAMDGDLETLEKEEILKYLQKKKGLRSSKRTNKGSV